VAGAYIYQVIDLAKEGMAVIVVSFDLEVVLGLSDRILVLAHGDPHGILTADEANQISVKGLVKR
jgi:ribose transport system ATP-binding protein